MGKQATSKTAQDAHYRMSELVTAAGVTRDMIKYYLRAKLLPKPHKPRRNLSLYTEQHLQLIRLILRIQQQTSLSLPEIAAAFRAADYNPTTIEIELLSDKYRSGSRDLIIPFEAETGGAVSLSFPQEFIEQLTAAGLLDASEPLDDSQVEIAGLLWAARGEGVPLAFFRTAREKLHELADLEVKALIGIQRPELDYESVVAGVTNTDRIINRWMVSEKTRHARGMFQRIIENSEKALSTIHEAIYFPSSVFRKRFRVDAELAALRDTTAANKGEPGILHDAARACLLLTEFELALEFADRALALSGNDDLAIACKSLAYGMANRLDEAIPYTRLLEEKDCRHSIAMEARLLTLLMQAAKLGGMSDTTSLLKKAAELFRAPAAPAPRDEFDRLEACLLMARANTIFPDAIDNGPEAIAALAGMLQKLQDHSSAELGLPLDSTRVVYQVCANFYMGQLLEAGGRLAEARQCFEEVIRLDPSSNFGEKAYLKLG